MQGEYFLRGVMETASGFKLNPDSTFEFFFSYGALDRYGSGTWKQVGSNVIFNGRLRPAKDFALVKREKVAGNFTTIRIVDNNTPLLQYVTALIKQGNTSIEKTTDSKGIISLPAHNVKTIALIFQLCPDRFSHFDVADESHNYFEFRFEPWIAEVFFENFSLKIEDNSKLAGGHPLLKGESYSFVKGN